MRDRIDDLEGATVVVVSFAEPRELSAHRDRLELPFMLLADPERRLYRAFGLGRGRLHEIWSLRTLVAYWRLLRRGKRPSRPTQDTRQLGGDFVIDRAGRLAAAFTPRTPADRPAIRELAEAVRGAG